MALKAFKQGEVVHITTGEMKGTVGTVIAQERESGRVEVDVEGTSVMVANGHLNWHNRDKKTGKPQMQAITIERLEAELGVESREVDPSELKIVDTSESKPTRECICGCGESVSKKARVGFVSGHDQRHKGNLLDMIRNQDPRAEWAETELIRMGWRTSEQIQKVKESAKPKATPIPTA